MIEIDIEGSTHRIAPAVLLLIEGTTSMICTFLREVWGGGKGEDKVPSVRASTQPDTTVGTVRFCTLYTKVFSRYKFFL